MKKEYIIGFVIGVLLLGTMSYKTTEGQDAYYQTPGVSIPLMQKNVIITKKYDYMRSLLKKGYICEDVDIVGKYESAYVQSKIYKYYTMVKY